MKYCLYREKKDTTSSSGECLTEGQTQFVTFYEDNPLSFYSNIILIFFVYNMYSACTTVQYCNGQWGGGVCGSWGKGSHLRSWGSRPARRGKRLAVGSGQWRGRDIARWPKEQETGSSHLQERFMHRVNAIVHCIAVIQYNHNRNRVLLYYLFQENKSFGSKTPFAFIL